LVLGVAGLSCLTPLGKGSPPQTNIIWGLVNLIIATMLAYIAAAHFKAMHLFWLFAGLLVMVVWFIFVAKRVYLAK
jgi:hypothetical protein